MKTMKLAGMLGGCAALLLLSQPAAATNTLTWPTHHVYRDMDPAAMYGVETYILGNIYETLTFYENGRVLPRLATAWEKTDGGATWTVTLREGVRFHDGSPLNAAAVKKSFEYTRDLGKGAGFLYSDLETVETPDERTAVFRFKKPIAFDLVASGQYGSYVIAPAAIDRGHDWMQAGNAIGTGPYRLTRFEPSKLVVLDRFDDYWGGWQAGQIDRVIQQVVFEPSTRVQMLRSGEADVAIVPMSQLRALDALPHVNVSTGSSWRNYMFLLNTQKYPTDNKTFREALAHLWRYDMVLEHVFQGYAQRPVGPLPATMWGHGSYTLPSYDLEKAKALLAQSGIPQEDWKITAMYSTGLQEQVDAIELFQVSAADAGVQVELLPEQSGKTYMARARTLETAAHLHSMVWWPAYPTPSDWLHSQYKTQVKTSWNLSYYSNKGFDAAVDAAAAAEGVDLGESAQAYIAAQDILMKDIPAIYYADADRAYAHAAALKGMEKSANPAYETLFIYALSR